MYNPKKIRAATQLVMAISSIWWHERLQHEKGRVKPMKLSMTIVFSLFIAGSALAAPQGCHDAFWAVDWMYKRHEAKFQAMCAKRAAERGAGFVWKIVPDKQRIEFSVADGFACRICQK